MKVLKWLKRKFLTFFGDIKYFKFPFFLVYDPSDYAIDGLKTREILKTVRPGDLILRRYAHYLDGVFIPGKYSHTGIYIGKGKMIHAVSEGVCYTDILEYVRCDGIAILRPRSGQVRAIQRAKDYVDQKIKYDFDFKDGDTYLYCHELGALCYDNLRIQKLVPKLFGGLIHSSTTRYLADSFFNSPDFRVVLELE